MELQQLFEQAVANSKNLTKKPDNDTLLKLYALYKQSTDGDVKGDRPSFWDMVGQAKYDAWQAQKGNSKETAMQSYIDLITKLSQ